MSAGHENESPKAKLLKRVPAVFYKTLAGGEPVREWLKDLERADKKRIGEDIKTVELGWPIGMPLCRPMGDGLHEVRTSLGNNRIARIFFYIDRHNCMVLLHALIKKTGKTPPQDIETARANKRNHEGRSKR